MICAFSFHISFSAYFHRLCLSEAWFESNKTEFQPQGFLVLEHKKCALLMLILFSAWGGIRTAKSMPAGLGKGGLFVALGLDIDLNGWTARLFYPSWNRLLGSSVADCQALTWHTAKMDDNWTFSFISQLVFAGVKITKQIKWIALIAIANLI